MLNKEKTITISLDEYNRLLESKKQVDELKDERENMQAEILRFEDMKFTQEHCNLYEENETLKQWLKRLNADLENEKNWGKIQAKQAVKDTAKEIYNELKTEVISVDIPRWGEPTEEDCEAVLWWKIEQILRKKAQVE